MKQVRCAIYTRKSHEEGLEQEFNSLDAQFAACSAYVASQASEGWALIDARYDDGGISGGTLERPALQRLLTDIAASRIDIVVVYKVDRLTRSLLDFARLVEAFDKAGTSFVSVTQSFNTTTSMGRLTLNMLLSFAQFEREVTAERIRDKLAASKRRGMWMGGVVPLGYKPNGRTLEIAEEHAGLIHFIFESYVELGSVRAVVNRLEADGTRKPVRLSMKGDRTFGGKPFIRSEIHAILRNPIYIGRIRHGDTSYPGLHPPIIDRELWDRAQHQLLEHGGGPRSAPSARHPSLLSQLLFDDRGEPLISTHANKGQVRHRYYVSRSLVRNAGGPRGGGMRVPAKEIERLVLDRLCGLLSDPVSLFEIIGARLPNGHDIGMIGQQGGVLVERLRDSRAAAVQLFLRDLISRIDIMPAEVRIQLNPSGLGKHLGIPIPSDASFQPIVVPAIVKRSGRAMRMMLDNGRAANEREPDGGLISTIAKAHRWWNRLVDEPGLTISEIARAEGVTPSWITRVIRLAFLDPAIVARIVDGKAPPHIDTKRLTQSDAIPLSWTEQRRRLGISERR
ncbi:recombinase family protein [Sphingopyxis sp. FD7]|jgi:DNA invertase Pin-like site-specific DNA recombinase|uniref:recombinase family protein n=1 Tax=Sphingopyxis sp. FD7 TaxID=1914525 RepID=UPI000DC6226E|nr:recombinase family protein [Sphingopyxis sp. FD7]BBB12231.1 resolvase [Sphingopyxis sp. FD7]